jgi:hypothetical protein
VKTALEPPLANVLPAIKDFSTILEFATPVTLLVKTALVAPLNNVLLAMKQDHFFLALALKNALILMIHT